MLNVAIEAAREAGRFLKLGVGKVRNIEVKHVTCRKMKSVLYLRGYPNAQIRGVRVSDSVFETAAKPDTVENVEGLELRNVKVNGQPVTR